MKKKLNLSIVTRRLSKAIVSGNFDKAVEINDESDRANKLRLRRKNKSR